MSPTGLFGCFDGYLVCDVLCAITLPEHHGLRLSAAVTRCQAVRVQRERYIRVWYHLRLRRAVVEIASGVGAVAVVVVWAISFARAYGWCYPPVRQQVA